jgi:hypothetical protein
MWGHMTDKVSKLLKDGGWIIFLVYIAGFFAWNFHLGKFGFFEHELLQTRFISAGFLILLVPLLIWMLSESVSKEFKSWNFGMRCFTFFAWIIMFSWLFFPLFPQYMGGGSPMTVSLLANPDTMVRFKILGVDLAYAGEKQTAIETQKVCLIYQNSDITIIGVAKVSSPNGNDLVSEPNRVLIMPNDKIDGLSTLPSRNWVNHIACKSTLTAYGVGNALDVFSFLKSKFPEAFSQ